MKLNLRALVLALVVLAAPAMADAQQVTLPAFIPGGGATTGTGPAVLQTSPTMITPTISGQITGSCGTVSVSTPCLDLTQTWNAGGVTFTGIRENITDTASASGSLLMDLQVASSSKFSVRRDGVIFGTALQTSGDIVSTAGNFSLSSGQKLQWNTDTVLTRDAANTLALRNVGNNQAFRVYDAYTDANNGAWVTLKFASAGLAQLVTEANGTGTVGSIRVGAGTGAEYILRANGVDEWRLTATAFRPEATNTYDVGTASLAPRDAFIARHLGGPGSSPAITSCGTSPSIVGSDLAGEVTTGTATPTACTITFNVAYGAQPYCIVEDRSALANLTSYTVSTSAIVLTTSAASSQKIVYHCIGA